MTALLVFVAAGVISWGLRVLFITVVPADRLSAYGQRVLTYAGTAVMAALAAGALARAAQDAGPTDVRAHVAAVIVAAILVRWKGNMALAVVGAIGAASVVQLVVA